MQELFEKVRSATENDRKHLPIFSYSRIDVYKNCPLRYKYQYMDEKETQDTSLALELGSLCHYVLEQKGNMIVSGNKVEYNKLNDILINGTTKTDQKTTEALAGINVLKRKYFDIWYEKDNASGITYEEKIKIFNNVLHSEMEDTDWTPLCFEKPFEFVWEDKAILQGFIDRIDIKDNLYKTVDYKTSKKIYDNSKLATSLQFGIYALAILNEFGVLPIESEYRFILINDKQYALTKGWVNRFIKTFNKLLDNIRENTNNNTFIPKPSPLCYWCGYCRINPNASAYKNECEYYSLWTPFSKSFEVNKKWGAAEEKVLHNKRKLIF